MDFKCLFRPYSFILNPRLHIAACRSLLGNDIVNITVSQRPQGIRNMHPWSNWEVVSLRGP
jgi:hypothetical protein